VVYSINRYCRRGQDTYTKTSKILFNIKATNGIITKSEGIEEFVPLPQTIGIK